MSIKKKVPYAPSAAFFNEISMIRIITVHFITKAKGGILGPTKREY